jgi:pimeloyl-ACP methyl ester carboxylesterase
MHDWALAQWRSTSPWAVAQAVAALGRHHSTPWLASVDIPTAVVVTLRDRLLPAQRQRDIAARIPGATVHEADCGHAGCVLQSEAFVPPFLEAVHTTMGRRASRLATG